MGNIKVFWLLLTSAIKSVFRRLFQGPRRTGWTWMFEIVTACLKAVFLQTEKLPTIAEQRQFLDTLSVPSKMRSQIRVEAIDVEGIPAQWIIPSNDAGEAVVYYLHGGGYVFAPRQPDGPAAQMAQATRSRVLALDYRLAPEHPFPAAIEDAVAGYRFLLAQGINPARLAIAGDSAGGGLALAVLLSLREAKERLPALAILLSPWVDLACQGESMLTNQPFDYLTQSMALQWARWYVADGDPGDPLASPINARLDGLPPLYIQAGGAEILIDQIKAFELQAKADGARVQVDIWEHMNHDFQVFGDLIPESRQAMVKIGEVFSHHILSGLVP